MKLEITIRTDLFNVTTITISRRNLHYSAEVATEEDGDTWIKNKLITIAHDTARKMQAQKEFFFRTGRYTEKELLAYQFLTSYLNQKPSLELLKIQLLPCLRDLIPHKTASHFELFNERYDFLASLCYGTPNNVNAKELHDKYICKNQLQPTN